MVDEVQEETPDGADASPEPEVIEAEAEVTEAEDQESEAESPPAEETEQKPDPFQDRIDKLTKRFRDTERDLDMVARERDELNKKLLELESKTQEPAKSLEDFDYDEAKYRSYLFEEAEKRAEKVAERVAKTFTEKQRESLSESRFAEREKAFAESVKDYQSVAYDENVKISAPMAEEIRDSELGPEMAYYLGKHPEEASRIAQLSGRAAIREMVKLEDRLQAEKQKPVKKVSKAPPPPSGIKGSEPGFKVSTTDPESDKMSDEEWFKREEARKLKLMKG